MSAFRLHDPAYARLRRAFTVWLGRIVLKRSGITEDISELHDLREVDAMLEERAAQWKDDYIRQGVLMGLAEGRMEGLAEGEAKGIGLTLRDFLETRFGHLPPSFPQLRRCLMWTHCVHWRSPPTVRNHWRPFWSCSRQRYPAYPASETDSPASEPVRGMRMTCRRTENRPFVLTISTAQGGVAGFAVGKRGM